MSDGARLLEVAIALLIYAAQRRWSVWRWLAVLCAVPVLLVDLRHPAAQLLLALALAAGLWTAGRALRLVVTLAGTATVALVWRLAAGSEGHGPRPVVLAALAVLAGVGLLAAAGLGRAAPVVGLRLATLAAVVAPTLALVITGGCAQPAVAWWPAAGALGLTALLRGRRGPAADRPQVDAVDEAALAEFDRSRGQTALAPVVVVIAAYNEADGLPGVLRSMPTQVCGLATDVLVVDDGSSDGTAEAARTDGRAVVVACTANRGQGAALRLGYRIARTHGASYLITTDADGQYDVADLPAVLQPVLERRADFVTGSRRLGVQENRDRVRLVGTYLFAWLASLLLGRHLTDTSFGLRAMRAEVTGRVTLNQPQYQASELLVGVVSHGFRVLEVPGTMHVRSAGSTKKGRNLLYGSRYARVMMGTWWREGCPAPVAESAPALGGGR